MAIEIEIENDTVLAIVVDEITLDRLLRLAAVCKDHPLKIAASLLADVLKEDDEAHPQLVRH